MTLLEAIQLIGYATGATLHFLIGALLVARRRKRSSLDRVLLWLAFCVGAFHAANLCLTLRSLFGLQETHAWDNVWRATDTVAVVAITLSYSLLLHIHLHLWATARERSLTRFEQVRVYLSYLPLAFLTVALPPLWSAGDYAPMLKSLSFLVLPFAAWAFYVLMLVATTDLLIARRSVAEHERRFMRWLGGSFILIAALLAFVHIFKIGEASATGEYLTTAANLASLLPTALVVSYIYRYRYLELVIRESLVIASFAGVALIVYLYGIRFVGLWLTEKYQLRAGVVETLLILAFAFVAAPLRSWLDRRFRRLFLRESALQREIVNELKASARRFEQLPELLRRVGELAGEKLSPKRIGFMLFDVPTRGEAGAPRNMWIEIGSKSSAQSVSEQELDSAAKENGEWWQKFSRASDDVRETELRLNEALRSRGFETCYPLRRDRELLGAMAIDHTEDGLTDESEATLELLAAQVAIHVADCLLVEQNVRLEREIAANERYTALGQMATTIAHEVKNPLSAIKSIAQVMREDVPQNSEYTRDLDLIVGETDRLSRSVSQLLSFARTAPEACESDKKYSAAQLLKEVVELFRADAASRGIEIVARVEVEALFDARTATTLRDALINLIGNSLQSFGGSTDETNKLITIYARRENGDLSLSVSDTGAGVPESLRDRIWQPFFTTKQRGTGLGLAIVKRRINEIGGDVRLLNEEEAGGKARGATFSLRVPLSD